MTDRQKRRGYFRTQKMVGLVMIIFAIVSVSVGLALGLNECGMILLAIPVGLWLIFTKDMVLDIGYKLEVEGRKQRAQ